ncbi:glycosyltransferase family 4 protein [Pedobacter sp. BS3]|uniref:glycosyltransferase family 4 protein n=1 Tax=Pedobacter sp. BS3 TaxID=2567937 RepID=UPI0011F04ED1|nr:glycosyltransferase family 1 protein [Pedobacter sp. BS3]TZF84994.1 glycosyltransferase family 4 protein [Pedobacter sp. BS3]
MTRILFDHQKFSTQRYGGISRYFANIIEYIKPLPDFSYKLGVLSSKNQYIKPHIPFPTQDLGMMNDWVYTINKLYCDYLLNQDQFDIFHPTYYDTYFFNRLKKPLVITVHDMTHERLPEYFWAKDPLSHNKRLNIERADKIIAISETTKHDLLKHTDVDERKIEVIYHGIDINNLPQAKKINGLPAQYILFVGDRGGYKNFYLFLEAFKQISAKYPDIHIVLTGGGNLEIAEHEYINYLKLAGKISHVHASDEELFYLYQNALFFVYPSLYEGFGLPILEAYRAGCPVILSDTVCFKEVAANAALFFSALSAESLAEALEKAITDTVLRENLIKQGKERLLLFPLEKSMDQTLEVYHSLGK